MARRASSKSGAGDPAEAVGKQIADGSHALVGPILIVISAISFGFMPLFSSWCRQGGVGLEMYLGLRFLVGAGVLTGLALRERSTWPRGGRLVGLTVLGAAVYFGEAFCYFAALSRGTPSGLVALLLYLYPVSVTVGAWLLFRERMTRVRLLALGLAILGLVLTIGPIEMGSGGGSGGGGGVGVGVGARPGGCPAGLWGSAWRWARGSSTRCTCWPAAGW